MDATVPADRSGIVTVKILLPNGPWFSATNVAASAPAFGPVVKAAGP
jgi:hypothetical protein